MSLNRPKGHIVSVLEGGYDLGSLGRSVAAPINTLADLWARQSLRSQTGSPGE
jgi:acetoin utilization deacetylase AcuC-like enzyme